jgi:hypothetical protein
VEPSCYAGDKVHKVHTPLLYVSLMPAAVPPEKRRSTHLGIRVTRSEHEALKAEAARHGMTPSEYVRDCVGLEPMAGGVGN